MAYKFQLGAAKLAGSITTEDITTDADGVISGSIGRFTHLSCSSNSLVLGSTTLSEDELGVLDGFTDHAFVQTADSLVFFDGTLNKLRRDTVSDVMTAVAGDGLGVASSQLKINVDDTGIETNSGTLRLKDGGVTADKMANLTATNLLVGNGSNRPTAVALSGDVTMNNAGAVTIANDAITSAKVADDAIISALIADDAVLTAHIADDQITNALMADNAIDTAQLADNAVGLAEMAGLARGKFIIGDASGDPKALALGSAGQFLVSDNDDLLYRSLSGDATLAANGALTIADEAVTYAKMQHVSTNARILGRNTSGAGDVEEVTPAQLVGMFNSDLGGNFTIGNQADDTATFSGGLTVNGTGSIGGDLVVTGDLTINGTTTTINSTTIELDDKNIELAKGLGNDAAVNGAGFTIDSSEGDKTFTFAATGDNFASSENMDLVSGKVYKVANAEVLSAAGAVKVQSAVAGDGLAHNSGVLSVGVDGSSIETSSDALRVKALGIATTMLAADAVTSAKIADDAIGSEHIADDAVLSAAIADDAIISALIADDAVLSAHIANNQITKALMADDAIGSAELDYAAEALATGADHFFFLDGAVDGQLKAESFVDYAAKLALGGFGAGNPGSGLEATSGQLKVQVADLAAITTIAAGDTFGFAQEGVSGTPSKKATIDTIATKLGGAGLVASSGVLAVQVSGALSLPSDHLYLSSSIAGTGLGVAPGDVASGIVTSLEVDMVGLTALGGASVAQADLLMINDDGAGTKKVTFSNLEDSIFGNVSGDATIAAGGALTIGTGVVETAMLADDAVDADKLASNAVVNASVASGAAIAFSKMENVTDGRIIVGNGSNVPTAVAVSGDATLANNGALTIANNAITQAKMADDAVGADELAANAVVEASIVDNAVTLAKMAGLARGKFIIGDSSGDPSALALGSAGQFLISDNDDLLYRSLSGDATLAANGAISLASSQTNVATMTNAALVLGRDSDNKIDFGTDNVIKFNANGAEKISIAAAATTVSSNLIITGDLTVQGAAVEIQQGFVVTSSVKFEGVSDGNETELIATNPTADRTITLPDLSGHVPLLAGAIGSAAVTAGEFGLLDGGSSIGTTAVATGHGIMMNHAGTMAQTSVATLSSFLASDGLVQASGKLEVSLNGLGASKTTVVGADSLAMVDSEGSDVTKKITITNFKKKLDRFEINGIGDADAVMVVGVNYATADLSADRTWQLPQTPEVGDVVRVKVAALGSNTLTVQRNASSTNHRIDTTTAISAAIESDNAAVEFVYVAANTWRVF